MPATDHCWKNKKITWTDGGHQRFIIMNFDGPLHTAWNLYPVSLLLAFPFSTSTSDLFSPRKLSISFSGGWGFPFFIEKIGAFNLDQPQFPTKIHLLALCSPLSLLIHMGPHPPSSHCPGTPCDHVSSLIYSTSPSLDFKNQLHWGILYI